ncbi:MAG: excinuclease ABC subunit C [Micavibrio sp.]|nr:excinuclease ABC subunit C [Micavibrio sp.]|tara:strand:+ start:502 stop:744 length:243 start_codon:yes stop_codon:yes gene_type:complete
MYFVYLIQSEKHPDRTYIGFSKNFEKRLNEHNQGNVSVTKSGLPWKVKVLLQFEEEQKAKDFELYLKHGSGHAFAKKRFW